MTTTPFPLGAYVGDPQTDPTMEAQFQSDTASFTSLMGTAPSFLDYYVDERQSVSQWISNASWQAYAAAQSPTASSITPIIGLPMTSTADSSISADQYYKNFVSGQYDSMIKGVVAAWAAQGFTTQYWRPGWEMNLPGMPSYAGTDSATQADWIAAYQHIYTVLHQAASADGVNLQVIWNPSISNYSDTGSPINTLYPGNQYVDIIGADVYADVNPYGNTSALYDWDKSGQVLNSAHPVYDSSVQQWASDPVNLMHYYTDPAATQWSLDGSNGHSMSLQNLIDFANAQGKPFAVVEAGAGNTTDGAGLSDNPTFVQWLYQTLANSNANIKFVNIWDSNGGGNYEFSYASDNKPLEAAAWAKYFGVQASSSSGGTGGISVPSTGTGTGTGTGTTVPAPITLGSGSDTIALSMSEDAYNGNAQVTISVDGVQIGGTQTITASHAAGQAQIINLQGNWGAGTHTVTVNFLNDAYGGTSSTDRNAYVTAASYDGTAASNATLNLLASGAQSVTVGTAAPAIPSTVTIGSGNDTLALKISEDAWQGDAQFTISVDGVQVGGTQTAQASHAAGQDQTFNVLGNWGSGSHTVTVNFLNDGYGGTSTTDRNLYLDGASYDGTAGTSTLRLMSSGAQSIKVTGASSTSTIPAATVLGSGSHIIDLKMSEDAWQGNGQFTVSVDGTQIGGTQTVVASHAVGQTQDFLVEGNFAAGAHTVSVNFLNDAYGGTSTTDRNIYVNSVTVDGQAQSGSLSLMSSGTQSLPVTIAGAATPTTDTLVLGISEDAYQGNAQFTVAVDGRQVGGTYSASASHAAGQSTPLTLTGNWGLGSHTVSVNFLNDNGGFGATDRNLFVTSATLDGAAQSGGTLNLYAGGTQSFTATTATTYTEGAAGGSVTTLGNDTVKIGAGNVTINAQGPSALVTGGAGAMTFIAHGGNDTITAAGGAATITASTGNLTFTEGTGAATVTLGSGKGVFDFINGQAGGSLTIANFVPGTDVLHLQGYSGTGIASESVSGGATHITLTDRTSITLTGVTDPYTRSVFG